MNRLYQISSLNNFKRGEFDGQVKVGQLKSYGDTGMGTFNGLAGEMIMVAGEIFQADGDCKLKIADDCERTPFSTLGDLEDSKMIIIENKKEISLIKNALDRLIKPEDSLVLACLKGNFSDLEIHSVHKQETPYQSLTKIVNAQKVLKFPKIAGTMVATRCPRWAEGLNVIGWHFHFISKDRNWGGHVNDFGVDQVEINYSIKNEIIQIDENPGSSKSYLR